MSKKERFAPPAVGAISLLVIFAVLCMTVFALLTLSTVLAERRMTEASLEALSAYYEADCEAERIFAQLRRGRQPEGVTEENGIFTYTCPISDTQTLEVALSLGEGEWTVLRWQAVPTDTAAAGEEIQVWDGESTT